MKNTVIRVCCGVACVLCCMNDARGMNSSSVNQDTQPQLKSNTIDSLRVIDRNSNEVRDLIHCLQANYQLDKDIKCVLKDWFNKIDFIRYAYIESMNRSLRKNNLEYLLPDVQMGCDRFDHISTGSAIIKFLKEHINGIQEGVNKLKEAMEGLPKDVQVVFSNQADGIQECIKIMNYYLKDFEKWGEDVSLLRVSDDKKIKKIIGLVDNSVSTINYIGEWLLLNGNQGQNEGIQNELASLQDNIKNFTEAYGNLKSTLLNVDVRLGLPGSRPADKDKYVRIYCGTEGEALKNCKGEVKHFVLPKLNEVKALVRGLNLSDKFASDVNSAVDAVINSANLTKENVSSIQHKLGALRLDQREDKLKAPQLDQQVAEEQANEERQVTEEGRIELEKMFIEGYYNHPSHTSDESSSGDEDNQPWDD